jgi:hypothetical protein
MRLCVVRIDGEQQRFKIINQQNQVIRHQNYIYDAGELKNTRSLFENSCTWIETASRFYFWLESG